MKRTEAEARDALRVFARLRGEYVRELNLWPQNEPGFNPNTWSLRPWGLFVYSRRERSVNDSAAWVWRRSDGELSHAENYHRVDARGVLLLGDLLR